MDQRTAFTAGKRGVERVGDGGRSMKSMLPGEGADRSDLGRQRLVASCPRDATARP